MVNQDQNKQTGKQDDQNEKAKRQSRKTFLIIGAVIILVILAFLIGTMNGKKEDKIVGVQPSQVEQSQPKAKQAAKTPEETLIEYLTAIQNKDYKKAASLISEKAKTMDTSLKENPEEWVYRKFKSEPMVRFHVRPEVEDLSESRKLYEPDLFVDNGWPQPKQTSAYFILEVENGIWKVNPTDEAYNAFLKYLENKDKK